MSVADGNTDDDARNTILHLTTLSNLSFCMRIHTTQFCISPSFVPQRHEKGVIVVTAGRRRKERPRGEESKKCRTGQRGSTARERPRRIWSSASYRPFDIAIKVTREVHSRLISARSRKRRQCRYCADLKRETSRNIRACAPFGQINIWCIVTTCTTSHTWTSDVVNAQMSQSSSFLLPITWSSCRFLRLNSISVTSERNDVWYSTSARCMTSACVC